MRIDEDGIYWFRQSWFGDFMMCPERARIKAFHPDTLKDDGDTDATVLGTAMHLTIETFLRGADWATAKAVGSDWLKARIAARDFRVIQIMQGQTMLRYLDTCCEGWIQRIFPQIHHPHPERGVEHTFRHQVGTVWGVEGTTDYQDEYGEIWDWKTAGGNYKLHYGPKTLAKKVQPTIYTLAGSQWTDGGADPGPQPFSWGISIKGAKVEATTRHTTRHVGDWLWLQNQVHRIINLYEQVGPDVPWPLIDDDWHCSSDWCQNWDNCKGGYVDGSVAVRSR